MYIRVSQIAGVFQKMIFVSCTFVEDIKGNILMQCTHHKKIGMQTETL